MFLIIAYITKVNLASLNGTESNGNITAIKKISSYNGDEYVYVSGQALRRYLKDTLMQLGAKITAVDENGNPALFENGELIKLDKKLDKNLREKIFKDYVDLDLFGYMFPNGERRWSPVKVAPLLSLLPYKGEVDFLTRKQKSDGKKNGNIVNVEIDTLNFMRGNIVINLEYIGAIIDEYTYQKEEILNEKEKKKELIFYLML